MRQVPSLSHLIIVIHGGYRLDRHTSSIRFRLDNKEVKIEQVVSMTEEKLSGNRMLCFRCQSEISGELRPFEVKFELETC